MTAPTIILPHFDSNSKEHAQSLIEFFRDFPQFKEFSEILLNFTCSLEVSDSENQELRSQLEQLQEDLELSNLHVKHLLEEVSSLKTKLQYANKVANSALEHNNECLNLIGRCID